MSVQTDNLDDWRRSHYSSQIGPDLDGKEVTFFGLVTSIRKQGGIIFLVLQDKEGIVQATIRRESAPGVLQRVRNLPENSFLGIRGTVKRIEKAPRGAEIVPTEIKILAVPKRHPPFGVFSRELPAIDKRLDLRAIDIRRVQARSIFRIRAAALHSIREYLTEEAFLEVNTPKIIGSATEGGAALFPLLYYDKEAFLAQSPQIYKEQLVGAFERVFEIGPIYRSEQFRTMRHLSETTSVDIEAAFVDYQDVMNVLEQLVYRTAKAVAAKCSGELEVLRHKLEEQEPPYPRYKYDKILELLNEDRRRLDWGDDIPATALKHHTKRFSGFYFITDWPTFTKAFYIKPRTDHPEISESFDFMYGINELSSGGTRISSRKELASRIKEKGLNPRSFEYHLKTYDYGIPPHAGWGLGFDRLMMVLTGQENIREVVLYPRDPSRLTP